MSLYLSVALLLPLVSFPVLNLSVVHSRHSLSHYFSVRSFRILPFLRLPRTLFLSLVVPLSLSVSFSLSPSVCLSLSLSLRLTCSAFSSSVWCAGCLLSRCHQAALVVFIVFVLFFLFSLLSAMSRLCSLVKSV